MATEPFQVRWALDLITAFVNKRINGVSEIRGWPKLSTQIYKIHWGTCWSRSGFLMFKTPLVITRSAAKVCSSICMWVLHSHDTEAWLIVQIAKALALVRNPLAYVAVDRVIDILGLANLDPYFVDEAARGFGILAEGKGKGKEKGSHLTTKVCIHQVQPVWRLTCSAAIRAKALESYPAKVDRR